MAVEPFLKYTGGKRRLATRIIELLPQHTCYVEPFGGMGAVLLANFFLDPPYADGDQAMYQHAFDEDGHRALRERLRAIRGRWVLTYGDHPLIRELYGDCRVEEVRRVRTINQAAQRDYVELIIRP